MVTGTATAAGKATAATAAGKATAGTDPGPGYSHSIVAGGLLVTSSTTRFTSGTSLVIRVEIRASTAAGSRAQSAPRLHRPELQVLGQPADVVVRLDAGRPGAAAGLHHVGVQRALNQELDGLAAAARVGGDVAGRALERADELAPDHLALGLRVGHAGQRAAERPGRGHRVPPHAGGGPEVPLHLLGLTLAQQPVIDAHAG